MAFHELIDYSAVSAPKTTLRIVHISDTHNQWVDPSSLPPGDILIHTGDFSDRGTEEEFKQLNFWLLTIADKYPVRIVVLGNHDVMTYGRSFDKMSNMLSNATHVPNAEMIEVCGLRILCLPYLRYQGHALDAIVEQLSQHRDIDMFLTHAPGYGVLDLSDSLVRCGSMAVKRVLLAVRPQCHLFGHVHEDYGFRQDGQLRILSVNSSMCDHPVTSIVNRGHMILFKFAGVITQPESEEEEESKFDRKVARVMGVINI